MAKNRSKLSECGERTAVACRANSTFRPCGAHQVYALIRRARSGLRQLRITAVHKFDFRHGRRPGLASPGGCRMIAPSLSRMPCGCRGSDFAPRRHEPWSLARMCPRRCRSASRWRCCALRSMLPRRQVPAEAAATADRAQEHGAVRIQSRDRELRGRAGRSSSDACCAPSTGRAISVPCWRAFRPRSRSASGRPTACRAAKRCSRSPPGSTSRTISATYLWQPRGAGARQRPGGAGRALSGDPRHQRAELRPPALARQHRRASEDQQPAQFPLLGRLGGRARRHQPARRDAARS